MATIITLHTLAAAAAFASGLAVAAQIDRRPRLTYTLGLAAGLLVGLLCALALHHTVNP